MTTQTKLYVILGSHPCRTGMLLLDHKGIPYRLVTLPTGFHPLLVKLLGFSGSRTPFRRIDDRDHRTLARLDRLGTVPALRMNGTRVQTNRSIARYLDEVQPSPPLFPHDPERRSAVEEAEHWGDEVFQMAARRLVLAAAMRDLGELVNRGADGRLGPLLWRNDRVRAVAVGAPARAFAVGRSTDERLLGSLPDMLDRIDAWIEDGTLNGDDLNAADFMIVTSLGLLCYRIDVRAEIERRPAGRLADRVLPDPARSG